MKITRIKILFIALLLSTAAPSLPAEEQQEQRRLSPAELMRLRRILVQEDLFSHAQAGDVLEVEQTLAAGANINKKNRFGQSALMLAATMGRLAVAELLVEEGADINAKDMEHGRSVLMFAVADGHLAVAELLIAKDVNVNAKNNDGYTALMFATIRGRLEIVKLLLENDADITIKNNWGETALGIARERNETAIVQLIRDEWAARQKRKKDVAAAVEEARQVYPDISKLISEFETE